MRGRWFFLLLLPLIFVLGFLSQPASGVSQDTDEAEATPAPAVTRPPSSTGPVTLSRPGTALPPGLSVAGIPVGGLTSDQVRAAVLRYRLDPLSRTLELRLDEQSLEVSPMRLGLQVHLAELMAQVDRQVRPQPLHPWVIYLVAGHPLMDFPSEPPTAVGQGEAPMPDLPLPLDIDETVLWGFLEGLAEEYDRDPLPFRAVVLTDTAVLSTSGVLTPSWSTDGPVVGFSPSRMGRRLDVTASVSLVAPALERWDRNSEAIDLVVEQVAPPETDLSLLETVLQAEVDRMPGVVGVYVRDLRTNEEIGVNERVLFSTASVIKTAIMLQVYRALDEPLEPAVAWDLAAMMVDSDNDAANRLLTIGGLGDEGAGARSMTRMLHDLGLGDSFMCIGFSGLECPTPPPEGWLPDAASRDPAASPMPLDPFRQTTPRDMGMLLTYLYECSRGKGLILERFPGQVTAEECRAMLDLMGRNADRRRMVSGLPEGVPVAHKSGWIYDMKADAGIVFSPGGPYVLSVYVWEEEGLLDSEANRRIAGLSWITYAFFNPLGTAQDPDEAATERGNPGD